MPEIAALNFNSTSGEWECYLPHSFTNFVFLWGSKILASLVGKYWHILANLILHLWITLLITFVLFTLWCLSFLSWFVLKLFILLLSSTATTYSAFTYMNSFEHTTVQQGRIYFFIHQTDHWGKAKSLAQDESAVRNRGKTWNKAVWMQVPVLLNYIIYRL